MDEAVENGVGEGGIVELSVASSCAASPCATTTPAPEPRHDRGREPRFAR